MIAVAGVAAVIWALFTGQVAEQGLDALFLIVVALVGSALFASVPLRAWRGRKPAGKKQDAHA
jgi:hypothetical protein